MNLFGFTEFLSILDNDQIIDFFHFFFEYFPSPCYCFHSATSLPVPSAGSLTFSDAHLEKSHSSTSRPGQKLLELWCYHQHQKHGQSAVPSPARRCSGGGWRWGTNEAPKHKILSRVAMEPVSRAVFTEKKSCPTNFNFSDRWSQGLRVCPDLLSVWLCDGGGSTLKQLGQYHVHTVREPDHLAPKISSQWLTVDGCPLACGTTAPTAQAGVVTSKPKNQLWATDNFSHKWHKHSLSSLGELA